MKDRRVVVHRAGAKCELIGSLLLIGGVSAVAVLFALPSPGPTAQWAALIGLAGLPVGLVTFIVGRCL